MVGAVPDARTVIPVQRIPVANPQRPPPATVSPDSPTYPTHLPFIVSGSPPPSPSNRARAENFLLYIRHCRGTLCHPQGHSKAEQARLDRCDTIARPSAGWQIAAQFAAPLLPQAIRLPIQTNDYKQNKLMMCNQTVLWRHI